MYGLHQGYSYQDLLTAFLISENLHKKDLRIGVEYKESVNDSFDDIVIIIDGQKTKLQVKHSSINKFIRKSDFTKEKSDLNLAKLSKSFLSKEDAKYVVITNRTVDVTPFFHENKQKTFSLSKNIYSIFEKEFKNKKFIQSLTIEANLPEASFDLSKPGNLEKELLESLRLKVGIGYYPNNHVDVRDVAGRLILLASKLRSSKEHKLIDRSYIFKYISLNFEYGHIAQNFPFISAEHRLYRGMTIKKIKDLISTHKFTILEGSPGSGKSHIFDDLFNKLVDDKVIVARHFCYLEPTDQLAQERIVVDAMYGNFMHQLGKFEPKLAQEMKPCFAATKVNIEKLIEKIAQSGKKVVLMVDGLDHLNRVVAQNKLSPDLINNFITNLLEIKLPKCCSVFIASQPSNELTGIVEKNDTGVHLLQPWDEKLVKEFVVKHNDHLSEERKFTINTETIKLLTEKTEGNPLYLTYVLKEVISSNTKIHFLNYIQDLPKLNNDLNNYYKYLSKDITSNDFAIVQTLALLDFSVSLNELGEMFPPIQKKGIDETLNKILPILKPGIVQGGIRIYHESFRRFVISNGRGGKLYKHITDWLENQGFFISQRAYRYLIPYLIRAKEENKIYGLLESDFVTKSLFYFHAVENILENLNKVANYSARKQRWDIYCKAVELRRSIYTYSEERFDSVDELYHQAILSVHGVEIFCERLIFDGKRIFSKPYGILLCKMAEHAGGNPPWDFYDVAGISMQIGDESNVLHFQEVEAAHFLNLIRESSKEYALKTFKRMVSKNTFPNTENRQIEMLLKEFDYVFGVAKNYRSLLNIRLSKEKKINLSLRVAEYLHKEGYKEEASKISTSILGKTKNISLILQSILFGGETKGITISNNIINLTEQILRFENVFDKEKEIFNEWYESIQLFSYIKPSSVRVAKKLITTIDGWYRAWIYYLFELSLLEASNSPRATKERLLEEYIKKLSFYAHPFKGKPRAMDLYGIREICTDSFRRTLEIAHNFSNHAEILNLLSNISKKTTSYLQGSSSGPFSGEIFNSLLKDTYPFLDEDKKKKVRKLIENNTKNGDGSSVYYDSAAFEYLKLATILALNKKSSKSKQCLMDGCIRLAAYGQRKDVTIYEIIEPIEFIAKKNLKFAIDAFKRSYPLVETVWRHTDGSSTNWSLHHWLKSLVNSDTKTSIQTLIEMAKTDSGHDFRIEAGIEYLCDKLIEEEMEPEIVANLYETIVQRNNTRIDVSCGLKIVKTLLGKHNKKNAQNLFNSVCSTLYEVSILEYVSEKENFNKILLFAKKNKLTIEKYHFEQFDAENKKGQIPTPSLKNTKTRLPAIPHFNFSKLTLNKIRRLIEDNPHGHFLNHKNIENFGAKLSSLEGKHSNEVHSLILSLVREKLYSDEDTNGLIALKNVFQKKKKMELVAFVSMLGFVYTRGGNGWHSLADSKYNYLGRESFRISKKVAQKTLASEMSYLFSKATYFTGPVRHLIEFFSTNGKNSMAQKIWDEAYDVIKYRLPTHPDLDKLLLSKTPSFNYKQKESIKSLLLELIRIRKT